MSVDDLIVILKAALAGRQGLRFAVLFGSAATRGPDQARDIDVAFSFARPVSWLELGRLAEEIEEPLGRLADLVDLENASTLLRWEILRTGHLILAPDRDGWLTFQARVPIEMADLRPHMERQSAGLRRALEQARWSGSTS